MNRDPGSGARSRDRLFFVISAIFLAFVYGVAVGMFKIFPYQFFDQAREGIKELRVEYESRFRVAETSAKRDKGNSNFMAIRLVPPYPDAITITDKAVPGINLVTGFNESFRLLAKIMDMEGRTLHTWDIDWFDIWPDAQHVPDRLMPKSKPGTHIHGAVVLENGDLVFNFEHLGLVRIDRDSQVVWRLPYRTHHSVHLHTDGNLWVSGQKAVNVTDPRFPQRPARVDKYTILEVSPTGEILNEWFVADLLFENGYAGLLDFNSVSRGLVTQVADDRLHLNDVEPFPDTMPEGFFARGDVLVSLRNVSTVFVFNRDTNKIKYITTGRFVQQHDPDFIDGHRFSVFDNNNRKILHGDPPQSRIVVISAESNEMTVFYEGSKQRPFFSNIMGKHQWLDNGHLLVTESLSGRAFELDERSEIVWEYYNYVDEGVVRQMEEVTRLPLGYAGWGSEAE